MDMPTISMGVDICVAQIALLNLILFSSRASKRSGMPVCALASLSDVFPSVDDEKVPMLVRLTMALYRPLLPMLIRLTITLSRPLLPMFVVIYFRCSSD